MKLAIGILFCLFICFSVSAAIFYDQGTDVVNSTGGTLSSGDLEIYIYDSASGGNLIYNANFTNNITNGSWNVKIEPDLEYGKIYYKDYVIEGDNLNFSGNDRIEFQSPFGVINNASFINFSLIGTCSSGSSIRQIYSNGSVVCEADDAGSSVNLTNYALTNESETFSENISVTNYGFFGWLGSLVSRVTNIFANNVNTINLTLNGTTIENWDEVNQSAVDTNTEKSGAGYLYNDSTTIYLNESLLNATIDARSSSGDNSSWNESYANTLYADISVVDTDTQKNASGYLYNDSTTIYLNDTLLNATIDARSSGGDNSSWNESYANTLYADISVVDTNTQKNASGYLYNDSTTIYLNESLLNATIDLRDSDTTYSHLSNFTDDLGDRGYTSNLNFTNDANYWNDTYATFNKTYADTLYSPIGSTSYVSKYSSGNFNGSLYTTGADSSLSDSNSIFQVMGSDGTPRLQIQNGGSEQASFIARSFMVVNQNNTRLNQSQNDLCSEWGFEYIDCNTSTTGADMGVQDDFEAQGLVYYREGIYGETSEWGAYSFVGNLSIYQAGGVNGTFTISNNYFCDSVSTPFSSGNADDENWVKIQSGDFEGAVAEISVFVNSSCVRLSDNPSWDMDLSSQEFVLIQKPVFSVLDGNLMHSHLGDSTKSKFKIDSPNGTSTDAFELNDVVGTNQRRTLFLDTNSFGFDAISNFLGRIYSSVSSEFVSTYNIAFEFIANNFNNSEHSFIDASIIGTKESGMSIDLITVSGDFDSYIKSGLSESIVKAYYDNAAGSTTDVTTAFLSSSSNVTLFENDNSIVYIGASNNFTNIEIVLDVFASADIGIVAYYCNNTYGWEEFGGAFSDSTNGFTSSGLISSSNPSDRGVCNKEIDGTPFANSTNYTYIALQRTRNNLVTSPVELTIDISGSSAEFILADDYIKLTPASSPPVTCDSSSDGAIYYDSDIKFHCSCKAGTGWVQMNDYTTGCS